MIHISLFYQLADTWNKNIVCQNDSISLDCEDGKILNIVSAIYGRTDGSTCKVGPILTTECFSTRSMDIISKRF